MRGNPLTCSRSHIRLPATLRTPLIRFGLSGYHPSGHGRFGRRRRTNAAARGPAGPFSPKTSAKTDATLVFKKIVKALALLFDFGVQRARQKFAVRPPRFLTRINLRLDRALRFHDARRTHVLPKGWAVGSTPCLGFRGAAASSFRPWPSRRDVTILFPSAAACACGKLPEQARCCRCSREEPRSDMGRREFISLLGGSAAASAAHTVLKTYE